MKTEQRTVRQAGQSQAELAASQAREKQLREALELWEQIPKRSSHSTQGVYYLRALPGVKLEDLKWY